MGRYDKFLQHNVYDHTQMRALKGEGTIVIIAKESGDIIELTMSGYTKYVSESFVVNPHDQVTKHYHLKVSSEFRDEDQKHNKISTFCDKS